MLNVSFGAVVLGGVMSKTSTASGTVCLNLRFVLLRGNWRGKLGECLLTLPPPPPGPYSMG